jgi:hypothetical protein
MSDALPGGVRFGNRDAKNVNWRKIPDNSADDDDEMAQTPVDVVAMLGFDPLDVPNSPILTAWRAINRRVVRRRSSPPAVERRP